MLGKLVVALSISSLVIGHPHGLHGYRRQTGAVPLAVNSAPVQVAAVTNGSVAHAGAIALGSNVGGVGVSGVSRAQQILQNDLPILFAGNTRFKARVGQSEPGLLKTLTDNGQEPPFAFIGCSDSRVSEGTVFDARPGTLFTQRNIANQIVTTDVNTLSVLAYGIQVLRVRHVIVMGHYGCGGVAAAIASRPSGIVDAAGGAVQEWIEPIRQIFETSTRTEIVELRNRRGNATDFPEPEVNEPGFMALVEENIKAGVKAISESAILRNHYLKFQEESAAGIIAKREEEIGPAQPLFVHGWVYNIENGEIKDLGISLSPPGMAVQIPTAADLAGTQALTVPAGAA